MVVSKLSEFNVNVSPGIIFTFCNIKIILVHQSDRATLGYYFSFAVLRFIW